MKNKYQSKEAQETNVVSKKGIDQFIQDEFVVYFPFNLKGKLEEVTDVFAQKFIPGLCFEYHQSEWVNYLEAYYVFEDDYVICTSDEDSADIYLDEIVRIFKEAGLVVEGVRWLGDGPSSLNGKKIIEEISDLKNHISSLENGDVIRYHPCFPHYEMRYFLWNGRVYPFSQPMAESLFFKSNKNITLVAFMHERKDEYDEYISDYDVRCRKTIRNYYVDCLKKHECLTNLVFSEKRDELIEGIVQSLQSAADEIVCYGIEEFLENRSDFLNFASAVKPYKNRFFVLTEDGKKIDGTPAIEYVGKRLMNAEFSNMMKKF